MSLNETTEHPFSEMLAEMERTIPKGSSSAKIIKNAINGKAAAPTAYATPRRNLNRSPEAIAERLAWIKQHSVRPSLDAMFSPVGRQPPAPPDPPLKPPPFTVDDWLTRDIPEPEFILGSWITTTSRIILNAPTGLGKTNVRQEAGAIQPVQVRPR